VRLRTKASLDCWRSSEDWGGRNGIEPSSPGWSPGALPKLCYSREYGQSIHSKYGIESIVSTGTDPSLVRESDAASPVMGSS
jgi:hypothetical protein